jgi:hypothetical protein
LEKPNAERHVSGERYRFAFKQDMDWARQDVDRHPLLASRSLVHRNRRQAGASSRRDGMSMHGSRRTFLGKIAQTSLALTAVFGFLGASNARAEGNSLAAQSAEDAELIALCREYKIRSVEAETCRAAYKELLISESGANIVNAIHRASQVFVPMAEALEALESRIVETRPKTHAGLLAKAQAGQVGNRIAEAVCSDLLDLGGRA